jgi:dihydroxyacetone kinase-like predicted kinase
VVDAGGRALCVVLDAAETAVTGRRPVTAAQPRFGRRAIPRPVPSGDLTPDGPAYEVMFLLDAPDERIPACGPLAPLGDSLVVVGGDGLWNVHVHVDDVGAAVEAGIEAGRPHRVRVTHFAEQVAATASRGAPTRRRGRGRSRRRARAAVREAGATSSFRAVPDGALDREILEAIVSTGAQEVIVLPNDHDSVAAAEAAARRPRADDVRVAVIRPDAQVQGLAALAVHEPGRPSTRTCSR